MSSELVVKGAAQLQAALDQLPAKIEANVMRGALRAGMRAMKTRALAEVPVGPPSAENVARYGGRVGLLRDSIRLSVRLRSGTVNATVKAGGKVKGGGDAWYAHIVHGGAKPHVIVAGKGKLLPIGPHGVKSVKHPGIAANPFMLRAFNAAAQASINDAAEYIRTRLRNKHGIDVPGPGNNEGDE